MTTPTMPLSRTPLHHWHAGHGARLAESDGWQVPRAYAGPERETGAARTGLAVADISAFPKVSLRGSAAADAAGHLLGDGHGTPPGSAARLHHGAPGLACRLTADHLLLLASTTAPAPLTDALAHLGHGPGLLESDVTSALAGFWLIGPRLEEVLRRLTSLGPAALAAPGSCAETGLAGVQALLVRSPELDVRSVRVYVSWELGEYVWEALLDAGRGWGIVPLGMEALAALQA
jgi:sarcosine oxidase subunit alpha